MTNRSQSSRRRKKVCWTISDEAREIVAVQPKGLRSQFVEDAILAWARRALEE